MTGSNETQRILGLIPARAGSTRLPGKNLRPLCGRSLIERAIDSALAARAVDEVGLSSDSKEYRSIAIAAGIDEDYLRPAALASASSSTAEAVVDYLAWRHATNRAEVSHVLLLQPTSPFRTGAVIDRAVAQWRASGKPSLVSVTPAAPGRRYIISRDQSGAGGIAREDTDRTAYVLDGMIYIAPVKMICEKGTFWDENSDLFITSYPRPFDIDDEADFVAAEALMRAGITEWSR